MDFILFLFFGHNVWHAGSKFPDLGLNLCPLQWKLRVLTIGLLGEVLKMEFYLVLSNTLLINSFIQATSNGYFICSCVLYKNYIMLMFRHNLIMFNLGF